MFSTSTMALVNELVFATILFFLTRMVIHNIICLISRRKFPPGPIGLPLVGTLPYMGSMSHVALAQMANKYGPIMFIKLGTCDMVVASSPESAQAFLKTLDMNFSNRPMDAGSTHLAYNGQDMVFASYGHRWRLLRKLSNIHMLGQKALDDWTEVRIIEVGQMLLAMIESSQRGEPVVVHDMLSYTTANMIGQVMMSRRVFETKGSESIEFKDMVVELMTIAGYFNIGDFIPILEPLDLQGLKRKMKCLHKKFDVLISKLIKEHRETIHERKSKPDFLDALLSYEVLSYEEKSGEERLSNTNIKALILNLLTAGTDTLSSAIEWALSELLRNPKILSRAQSEMDMVIGRDRRLKETDIAKLPYLKAICKEAFRKHPSTPLNLPRVSTEACEVNGYYIPKNTRLSVNIWAIGRDSSVWENPLEFKPERFLSGEKAKVDPRGNDFELIPFGAGRRICAGARMGIVLVEYVLGSLVHSFDWKLDVEELNMDETFGITLQKAIPLSALVTPRLSSTAYAT